MQTSVELKFYTILVYYTSIGVLYEYSTLHTITQYYNSIVYVCNTLSARDQQTEIKFTTELGSVQQQVNSACLLRFPAKPYRQNYPKPVHLFTHYLSKTQSNIILPSISRSATWSLLFRFPVKKNHTYLQFTEYTPPF
jgi:hypothetical protein